MQDFDFKNQIYLNFYRLRLEIRTNVRTYLFYMFMSFEGLFTASR